MSIDQEFVNGLKMPIIVLGYDLKKLFSVNNNLGHAMIPVFSNAEYAQEYRNYFQKTKDRDIMTFLLDNYNQAIDLFEVVSVANPAVRHIIVDPMPPTLPNMQEKVLSFEVLEYVQRLRNCKSHLDKNKRRRRKY